MFPFFNALKVIVSLKIQLIFQLQIAYIWICQINQRLRLFTGAMVTDDQRKIKLCRQDVIIYVKTRLQNCNLVMYQKSPCAIQVTL